MCDWSTQKFKLRERREIEWDGEKDAERKKVLLT